MSRKHGRSDDNDDLLVEQSGGKRQKLDNLFENLNIDSDVIIEPQINKFSFIGDKNNDINFYISQKLNQQYNERLCANYAVIKWYNYRYLVIFRFQKWAITMFNRFLKNYNKKHGLLIPPVATYDKIFRLIDGQLSHEQLFSIILQENKISLYNLQKKFLKAANKQHLDQIQLLDSIKYDYWDNLPFDKDFEMKQSLEEPENGNYFSDSDEMNIDIDDG